MSSRIIEHLNKQNYKARWVCPQKGSHSFYISPRLVCWINRLSGGALVTLAGALAFYRRAHN
jgi:hypothetical protein